MTRVRRAPAAVSFALVLATAALLVACSRSPTGPDRERALEHRGATVARDAAAPAADADADAACIAECVRARQMEAIGIDVIERTCAQRCSLPPPTF